MTGDPGLASDRLTVVQSLSVSQFRNIESVELLPSPGLTVVRGDNGAGKTSLLEALGYCSLLKSFRGVPREALVRHGHDRAEIVCNLMQGSRRVDIEISLVTARRDHPLLNRQRVGGAKDLVEALRTTLFTPDDLDLVKGAPGGRRDLLDDAVLATHPRLGAERANL
ncbi:MAG: AAA family ATPase, partial [Acidimicrobiales bacterium]